MDRVRGTNLRSAWPSMDSEAREGIYRQVSEIIAALHAKEVTLSGPVGGGMSQGFYFTDYGAGPFKTCQEMERWFNERQRVWKDFGRVKEDDADFSGTFNRLVTCHMDLHRANMVLDADNKLWLLDWESAGGYPVFFEEAQLAVGGSEPEDVEFRKGLLKLLSSEAHAEQVARLESLNFAITTGWRSKPGDRFNFKPL